jgi:uncharacterized protein
MGNGYILSVLTPDSVEDNGKYNQASGDRLIASGEFEKAFAVYMVSAREGFAPCQNSVGFAYEYGEGVTQDLAEAARWFKMAADQNNPDGQYNISQSYIHGTGVPKNHDEGIKYLVKAANNNHPTALFNLGCISDREGEYEQAFEYFKRSAEAGHPPAQHNLGMCYAKGEGTQRNDEKAISWFRVAAGNGVEDSKNILRKLGLL